MKNQEFRIERFERVTIIDLDHYKGENLIAITTFQKRFPEDTLAWIFSETNPTNANFIAKFKVKSLKQKQVKEDVPLF